MRTFTRTAAAGALAAALVLAGCGSDDEAATDEPTTTEAAETTEAAAEILIGDPWARQSPMGTTAGAVYMTITSPVDDALLSASVPEDVAGTVEIHETVMAEEGMTETTMAEEEMTETTMAEEEMTETTMGEDMGGDDGMDSMTMQPIDKLELPAGEEVALEPGGYHIMLLDLVEPLVAGESIEVTLEFESGATQTVTAEVREG